MASASSNGVETECLVQAKPPFLRRVQIRGYKSLAFCDVKLEPLTILVGRNASGKSNFLDALAFLRDAINQGLNAALENHGGMAVFSQELQTNRLMFEIETEFPGFKMEIQATYRIDLVLNRRRQLEAKREILHLEDLTNKRQCSFSVIEGKVTLEGLDSFQVGKNRGGSFESPSAELDASNYLSTISRQRKDRLLLGMIGDPPILYLAEGLSSMGLFNFHPEAIREPQPSVGTPALKRDGRNLARAIEGLREIEEADVRRVEAYLRAIVPGIEGFDVVPVADRETIIFRVRSRPDGPALPFFASSMSDGTLRALASLVAAFQITLPFGPDLIGIEEPDTALHPAAMRALVAAMDEATLRTQIILTTHSPDLLDAPEIKPANIRVVQLIDGHTVIGPVDAASVSIVRDHLSTLGALERERQLEPDIDDLQRQSALSKTESASS